MFNKSQLFLVICVGLLMFGVNNAHARTIRIRPSVRAEQLQGIINQINSGDCVVFPKNRNYVVEETIVFNNLTDVHIRFRGCLFRVASYCKLKANRVDTYYIDPCVLQISKCKNLFIENLVVDGNRTNNGDSRIVGLSIAGTDASFESLVVKNCSYHHIVIGDNSNLCFVGTRFENLGNIDGHSDVFTSYKNTDVKTKWENTYSLRREADLCNNTGQVFYFGGGDNIVHGLHCINCFLPFDQRSGKLYVSDVYMNVSSPIRIQSYPDQPSGSEPDITVDGMHIDRIINDTKVNSFVYVTSCKRLLLKSIYIDTGEAPISPQSYVRIRKYKDYHAVSGITIDGLTIHHQEGRAYSLIDLENLTNEEYVLCNVDIQAKCYPQRAIKVNGECCNVNMRLSGKQPMATWKGVSMSENKGVLLNFVESK